MMRLDSIFVEADWYPILCKGLTEIKNSAVFEKEKTLARECLRALETGLYQFDKGERAQVVFTASQKRLLARISTECELELAQRRFEGRIIGEFEQFGRSKR